MSKELSLAIKIGGKVDSSLNSAFSAVQKGISGATKAMAAATLAGVGAVAAITKKAIDVGSEFEKSMSQVQATMLIDTSTAEGAAAYETLENAARECGRQTAFSATEAAEGLNYLALAGYDAEKAAAALPTVLRLAGAGAMELADASDMVTDAMSALGIEATQTNLESFADKLAKAASVSNTSVSQLGEAILAVGGTAKGLAGGTTELNAALGILADNGIKGAEGGTHLRNMLLSLQNPRNADAAALFKKMSLSAYDAQGNMRSLGDIFGDINNQMAGMSAQDVNGVLATMFKQTDLAAARAMLAATADSVQSLGTIVDSSLAENGKSLSQLGINLEEMAKSFDSTMSSEQFAAQMMEQYGIDAQTAGIMFEGLSSIVDGTGNRFDELTGKINDSVGACQEMYNIQLDNLKGDLDILNSAADDLYISIFNEINPGLRSMVKLGQEMIGKLSAAFDKGGLSGMVGAIGEVIADAVDAIADVAPQIVQMGVDMITSFVHGIASSAGKIGNVASTIGSTFMGGLFDLIPTVILTGIDIAVSFVEGIVDGLPEVMTSGTKAVNSFVEGLVARTPKVISTAISLIKSVARGIIQNAPQLIRSGTELITGLITGLADGVSNNLPEIIDMAGDIVESISQALIEAAPQLIEAGSKIVAAAGKGISDTVKTTFEDIGNGTATLSQVVVTFAPFLLAARKIAPIFGQAKSAIAKFNPVIAGMGSKMKLGMQTLINFPSIAKNFIIEAGGMRNALSGLAKGGLTKIGGIFKAIASPAGIAIGAIALLTGAFIHLWNTNEGFRNAISGIWGQITSTVSNFAQSIASILNGIGFDFENISQVISTAWNGLCSILAPLLIGTFQFVADALSVALNTVSGIINLFVSAFRGDWSGCWEAAKSIASGAWNFICETIDNIGQTLCGIINACLTLIGSDWEVSWEGIKEKVSGAWDAITGIVSGALDIIKGAISIVMDIIHGDWSGAWEKISTAASSIVNAIPGALSNGWETLKSGISEVGSALGPLLDSGWETIKTNAVNLVSGIPGDIAGAWETLKSGISEVGSTLGPLLDSGWELLKQAGSNAINGFPGFLQGAWDGLKTAITGIGNTFGPLLNSGWELLKQAGSNAINGFPGFLQGAWDGLKTAITGIGNTFGPLLNSGWNALKDTAGTMLGEMPGIVSEKLGEVTSKITDIGGELGGLLDEGWGLLKTAAENAASAVQKAWEGVKDFFGGIWDAITGGGDKEVSAPAVDTSGLSEEAQMKIQIDSEQVDTANSAVQTLSTNLKILQALTAIQLKINTGALINSLSEAGENGGIAFTAGLDGSLAGYTFNPSSIGVDTAALTGILGTAGTTGGTAFTTGLDSSLAGYSFDTSSIGVDTETLAATLGTAGTTGGEAFTAAINNSISGFSVDTAIGVDTTTVVNNMSNAATQGSTAFASSLSSSLAGQTIDTSSIVVDSAGLAATLTETGAEAGEALGNGINASVGAYNFNPDSTGMTVDIMTQQGQKSGQSGGQALTQALETAIRSGTGAVTSAITSMMVSINNALNNGWETAKSSARSAMSSLQSTCAAGAQAAANAVRSAFANMRIVIPRPSIPVINVSTSSVAYGKGGSVSIPHFSVSWNALGGIFDSPTILPTLQGLQGVGEAGPEAILPLDTLWQKMEEIMNRILNQNTDGIIGSILGKLTGVSGSGKQEGMEVAGTGMVVNFSPTYVLQGTATKEDAKEAAKLTFSEFKKFMEQYEKDKQRKRFK